MTPLILTAVTLAPVALAIAGIAWGKMRKRSLSASLPPVHDWSQQWADADFFTAHRAKTLRLTQIAAELVVLNEKRLRAKRNKKSQSFWEKQMQALTNERLRIENGEAVRESRY